MDRCLARSRRLVTLTSLSTSSNFNLNIWIDSYWCRDAIRRDTEQTAFASLGQASSCRIRPSGDLSA